jgi:hypothetical protein
MGSGWLKFLGASGATAAGFCAVGLTVGPKIVASVGLLLALALGWPALLLAGGLLLGIVVGLLSGSSSGAELAEAGIEGGVWYYPRLFTCKSPSWWGVIAGGVVATAGLFLYVESEIRPREAFALEQLEALAEELGEHRKERGTFPEERGPYLHQAVELAPEERWHDLPLRDPWQRPILYSRSARGGAEWFEIVSTAHLPLRERPASRSGSGLHPDSGLPQSLCVILG